LFQAAQLINDAAIHDAELAGVMRNIDIGQSIYHAVPDKRHELANERLALAALASLGQDDVVAFVELAVEIGDDFRRILQVDVDHHARLPDAMVQAGHDGTRLAKASAEDQHADA